MNLLCVLLLSGVITIISIVLPAQAGELTYVAQYRGNDVTIIDTSTKAVIGSIPVGMNPETVVIDQKRKLVYVANWYGYSVSVIDATTNTLIYNIPVTTIISNMTLDLTGKKLYLCHIPGWFVTVIDTDNMVVSKKIETISEWASGIAIAPNGEKIYVAHYNHITLIDTINDVVLATIPANVPRGWVTDPSGTRLYVAIGNTNTVQVLDANSLAVIADIPVSLWPHDVIINPSGTKLYVGCTGGNAIDVIDTTTLNVVSTIVGVTNPRRLALNENDKKLYATSNLGYSAGNVSVVNTDTNLVTDVITVGVSPSGIALYNPTQKVAIDIRPDSATNPINPKSRGVIPVAILSTSGFDALTVDPSSVTFGAVGTEAKAVMGASEDVNGDGVLDLLLHFETQATGIEYGLTSANLKGKTFDRTEVEGSDVVNIVGSK